MSSRWMPRISAGGVGGGPPAETVDRFAPKYLVGNVAAGDTAAALSDSGFVYIADPGDGSGIAAAFALAAVTPGDVWLRPGVYDLRIGAVTTLTQPAGVLCRGAGTGATIIIGVDVGNQTILTMGDGAQLRDMQVLSPAPLGATAGATLGVVEAGGGVTIRDCVVGLARSTTENRSQIYGIRFASVNGRELVVDTRCLIDSLNAQPQAAASQAIVFGDGVTAFASLPSDSEVRDVFVNELTPGAGSCQRAVFFQSVSGGRCFNVEHANARTPVFGSLLWSWGVSSPGSIVRAPKISHCRMEALDDQTLSPLAGVTIALFGSPGLTGVVGLEIDNCRVRFQPTGAPVAGTDLNGFVLVNSVEDSSALLFGQVSDCTAFFSVQGFLVDASGTTGRIADIRFTGCIESTTVSGHTTTPRGMRIRGETVNQNTPTVRHIGVVNCDFRPQTQGARGVEIDGGDLLTGVADTIVVANSLKAGGGGTALVDNGTGTQAGLNIL